MGLLRKSRLATGPQDMVFRPSPGDSVRVGLGGLFICARPLVKVGAELIVELTLPTGAAITPRVKVGAIDADWFACEYVSMSPADREALEAYHAGRRSADGSYARRESSAA